MLQKSRGGANYGNDERGFMMEPLDVELARKQLEIIARDLKHDHEVT